MSDREYKLMHGNCLELMNDIPDGSVDMVLCDPPYGTTDCKWDNVISFAEMWKRYNRIIKEDGVVALFASQPFTTKLIGSNFKRYRYNWYWLKNVKTGYLFAKVQPMRQVEEVCIFYKKHPTYLPQGLIKLESEKVHRKRATQDSVYRLDKKDHVSVQKYTNYPSNVLQFDSDVKGGTGRLHPTQKPVDLLEYLVRTYTNQGETKPCSITQLKPMAMRLPKTSATRYWRCFPNECGLYRSGGCDPADPGSPGRAGNQSGLYRV